MLYTYDILDSINLDFFYDYIDNCKHVAILGDRKIGKTTLSQYFFLSYVIKNTKKTSFFTSKTQIHQNTVNEILHYINKSNMFKTDYNIKFLRKQINSNAWFGHINNLINAMMTTKIDLSVIDEINSYDITEKNLNIIKSSIHNKGTKLLINGSMGRLSLDNLVKLGIEKETKIIDDDFIKNINIYSRNLKIKKITGNIEKSNCICF